MPSLVEDTVIKMGPAVEVCDPLTWAIVVVRDREYLFTATLKFHWTQTTNTLSC